MPIKRYVGIDGKIYDDEYKRLTDAGVEIAGFLYPVRKAFFLVLNKDK